jgi:hypothetical protein
MNKYTSFFVIYIVLGVCYIYNKTKENERFTIAPAPTSAPTSAPTPALSSGPISSPGPGPSPGPSHGPAPGSTSTTPSANETFTKLISENIQICKTTKYNLSLLFICRNDQLILDEFMNHYIWQGVEHFYIIDNGSTDYTKFIITNNMVNDRITYYYNADKIKYNTKYRYYSKVYSNMRSETKWLIICDIDEYIYSRYDGFTIKNYVNTLDYYKVAAVNIACKLFGSNDIVTEQENMRTTFLWRDNTIYPSYKSIINTSLTTDIGETINTYNEGSIIIDEDKKLMLNKYTFVLKQYYMFRHLLRYGTLRDDTFYDTNKNEVYDEELKNLVLGDSTKKGALEAYGRPPANFVVL